MKMDLQTLDNYCDRKINRSAVSDEVYRSTAFNDSCLESFFYQLHQQMRRFNAWEEILYTSVYIVISVLAVIGNGLVILAVIRKKAMRTNRNVLILNLAISNLMLAFTNIPFLWLPSIEFDFPYSRIFCKFANVLPGSNVYCSTLTISVMAIDRYYSVKRLKMVSSRKQCVQAICVSLSIWIMSFILSLPLLIYYETSMLYVMKDVNVWDANGDVKLRSYGWRQCRLAASRSEMNTQSIQLFMCVLQVVFLYIVPLFVLGIFNVKLTRFLKSNANQMSRNRGNGHRARVDSHEHPRKENQSLVQSLRSPSVPSIRSSIAEKASERRTSRTTSLLIAMAGSYAILWLPFTVITFLLDLDILFNEAYASVFDRIDQICKMVSMLSICVNPFLYGFLNTNFRHEFTEIYYKYIRCQIKPIRGPRFTHEFSSMAITTRQNSMHLTESDVGFFSVLRRSVRGSMSRLRSSVRSDNSTSPGTRPKGTTHISVQDCSVTRLESRQIHSERIVLDAESERDSFV